MVTKAQWLLFSGSKIRQDAHKCPELLCWSTKAIMVVDHGGFSVRLVTRNTTTDHGMRTSSAVSSQYPVFRSHVRRRRPPSSKIMATDGKWTFCSTFQGITKYLAHILNGFVSAARKTASRRPMSAEYELLDYTPKSTSDHAMASPLRPTREQKL